MQNPNSLMSVDTRTLDEVVQLADADGLYPELSAPPVTVPDEPATASCPCARADRSRTAATRMHL